MADQVLVCIDTKGRDYLVEIIENLGGPIRESSGAAGLKNLVNRNISLAEKYDMRPEAEEEFHKAFFRASGHLLKLTDMGGLEHIAEKACYTENIIPRIAESAKSIDKHPTARVLIEMSPQILENSGIGGYGTVAELLARMPRVPCEDLARYVHTEAELMKGLLDYEQKNMAKYLVIFSRRTAEDQDRDLALQELSKNKQIADEMIGLVEPSSVVDAFVKAYHFADEMGFIDGKKGIKFIEQSHNLAKENPFEFERFMRIASVQYSHENGGNVIHYFDERLVERYFPSA
jgi:hypothetical protein